MANKTPMKKFRLASQKSQKECAGELAALSHTKINQSRWSALEINKIDLAKADYMTVFWISLILDCKTWELVPRAKRRFLFEQRKAVK